MEARVDILSPITGRVLLSSLLDAPSDGLSRAESWEAIRILQRAQRELEKKFGKGYVRLTLDSYEGTVFWFLVLFCPIIFDKRHAELGSQEWSIYELLRKRSTSKLLSMTDIGLVVDLENMWLAMNWKDARKGIMKNFDDCASWKAIIAKQQRRLKRANSKEKVGDDYWKQCARSFSYTIPTWQLEKMGYLKDKMWYFGKITYADLIVLDLAGMDILKLDVVVTGNVKLPVAKRARFAHFYTDDPREYRAVKGMISDERRQNNTKKAIKDARRANTQRERRKARANLGDQQAWYDASRLIAKLPRLLGKGLKSGRYQKLLSGKKSDQLYNIMVDAFINGEFIDPNKKELELHLAALENLLEDESIPKEFRKWLKWKNGMLGVRKEVEAS